MKKLVLLMSLMCAAPLFAQGIQVEPTITKADLADAGVIAPAAPSNAPVLDPKAEELLDNPLGSFRSFYTAAKEGKWALAAMFMLFFVVGGIRLFGKKLHALIPDDNWLDKPFYFIFDTKVGGWVLNWLTSIGGCLAMAYLAHMEVDGHAWRTAVMASTGATALIELKDDVMEWWEKRKAAAVIPQPPVIVKP